MKLIISLLLLIGPLSNIHAQHISKVDLKTLQQKEDSLKTLAYKILEDSLSEDRYQSDSLFTKILVRALKTNYSYYYPFDSLFTISLQYPADSSFRIFTWQLVVNEDYIKQRGAIQMNTRDGSLKIFPLFDRSENIENEDDTITNNQNWIGAIYYRLIQTQYENKKYYTMIGFDQNNSLSHKKIMDILHFENELPVFGAHIFSYPKKDTSIHYPLNPARFVMAYKKFGGPVFNYDEELEMIIKEHLVSESNEPDKLWTLVGDGDYEGFKWEKGKWNYIKKVFNQVTPEGQPPVPEQIRDDNGNIKEEKLKPVQ